MSIPTTTLDITDAHKSEVVPIAGQSGLTITFVLENGSRHQLELFGPREVLKALAGQMIGCVPDDEPEPTHDIGDPIA